MKLFYFVIFLFFLNSCSFDNKSGIWKDISDIKDSKDNDVFKDFSEVIIKSDTKFDEIINIDKNYDFSLSPVINPIDWKESFYNKNNNYSNFQYKNENTVKFMSKKLSRFQTNKKIFFTNDYIFLSDIKGNIFINSFKNKDLKKFNFYKKNFKNIEKQLNIILEDNKIFVTDNIGYFYAIDYINSKIIWAKNYKIPLRSNVKLTKNKIIFADQNNNLIFANKNNGEIVKRIPTEEVLVKNNFQNNLTIGEGTLFFLNVFGSLYSINLNNLKINWVLNINESLELDLGNLFEAQSTKFYSKKLTVLTNKNLSVLNANNGSYVFNIPLSGKTEPLISGNQIFIITKNNLLVCVDFNTGKIIYSYNINQKIADYLKIKKNKVNVNLIRVINNNLYLFLHNSYIVKFNIRGEIKEIQKLKKQMSSDPIFIDGEMIYLDKKNKLIVVD